MQIQFRSFGHIITTLEAVVIITTTVATIGTAVWSLMIGLGPLVVPAVAVTGAAGLYAYSWVRLYKRSRAIPRSKLQPTIMEWLTNAGHQVGLRSVPNVAFGITATAPSGRHLTIYQPTESPGVIGITYGMRLSDKHRTAYNALSSDQKDTLVRLLQMNIAQTGFEWEGFLDPLDRMAFARHLVYDETFNQRVLIQTVFDIIRGATLVSGLINIALKTPPDKAPQIDIPVDATNLSTPDTEDSQP